MKLYIKEKVFSWGDKFFVKDAFGNDRYTVVGEVFSLGKRLHVYDMNGKEAALIQQKAWSLFPQYIVTCNGKQIAQIQKKLSFFFPRYTIDGLGWEINGNFLAHEYSITLNGATIVSIQKEWMT